MEDAKEGYPPTGLTDLERNHHPAPVIRDLQIGPHIVASCSPQTKRCQTFAVRHDGIGVALRQRGRTVLGEVFVELDEVVFGLGREDNGLGSHDFLVAGLGTVASRART